VGCSVVISHDRWFLDRVATHILAFEGDSKVFFFDGNYSAYEADRRRRLGIPADAAPRRIQYRALTRERELQISRRGMITGNAKFRLLRCGRSPSG
jgi:ATPase subunit of ABC transporter with duplicated ATPase domains